MISSLFNTISSKVYLAQSAPGAEQLDSTVDGTFFFFFFCCLWIFLFAGGILVIVAMYKLFEKAGQPGWTAIVPYLNSAVLAHIAGRPWWWGIIPFLNLIPIFELAKKFGKSEGYGIGLILLPWIFFPMLGFGKAQLVEPPQKPLF